MKDRNLLLAYVIAGILTLAFQIWWRSFECGDACALSYTEAVIWSVVWQTLHDAQDSYLPNQAGRVRTFSNSPIFSEAFSPDPVNTSTVASPCRMTPRAMSCDNPAAAAADVGST